MPNWVLNKLTFETRNKELRAKIFAEISSADGDEYQAISFEKIAPMPKNIYRGNLGDKEREQYGKNNWYDWSLDHWGTKWDATQSFVCDDGKTIEFQTAWSAPVPVIKALSEEYPDVFFVLKYADENLGHNCGTIVFKDGTIIMDREESLYFACDMWGADYDWQIKAWVYEADPDWDIIPEEEEN